MNKLAERLKQARKVKGLSQKEMAKLINVSQSLLLSGRVVTESQV